MDAVRGSGAARCCGCHPPCARFPRPLAPFSPAHARPLARSRFQPRQVHWRFTHNRDIVPSVPPGYMGFYHLSREVGGHRLAAADGRHGVPGARTSGRALRLRTPAGCPPPEPPGALWPPYWLPRRPARGRWRTPQRHPLPALPVPPAGRTPLSRALIHPPPTTPPLMQVWMLDLFLGRTLVGVCDASGEDMACHNSMCHLGLCSSGVCRACACKHGGRCMHAAGTAAGAAHGLWGGLHCSTG